MSSYYGLVEQRACHYFAEQCACCARLLGVNGLREERIKNIFRGWCLW